MPALHPARAPLPQLIEESLEEAAFLWGRWHGELASLTRNLDQVWSWTEDRLHGALAGVRVSGENLSAVVGPGLGSEDWTQVTVCAALLGASPVAALHRPLLDALAQAQGPRLTALVRALELTGCNQALSSASLVLANADAAHSAALCRLKTFRRAAPGPEMAPAFESDVPELQVSALRAARYLQEQYLADWIDAGLRCPHPEVRLAAVESGLCRGVRSAWSAALDFGSRLDPNAGPYLRSIAMLGSADEQEIVYSALRIPHLQSHAIWALGHIGTRRAVESCLHGMKHEKLARAAAEAYCHITGANLAHDNLIAAEPADEAPAFEDDNLDADLVPSAQEMWPLPDPEATRKHWQAKESAFRPEARYVGGRAVSLDTLLAAVENGPMLRRPDLILNLAAKTHGRYDVEPLAFTARQRRMMAGGRAAIAGGAAH